ncbi:MULTISPECIES: DUF5050 domain-containing protein [unclassified Ruminococcus]|uniref:DUF5050 domain-containing protein n=1 Tax=unclassified Ruminococcus TaxID=2608920 RepID=UPI00210DB249|nr:MULTISPECIES: DUF5050 domain-containing protein [unclassified Ruminococcus]MCQ4023227.1 hypothetical protein [Ruminococcus sp. zg-924]MCQ4115608.1 hypothetical protein [Ruminococcus sp. zg-921]
MKLYKKIILVLSVTICAVAFCSCAQQYPTASDFSAKEIENSYNNTLSGARMGYHNNTLYCPKYTNGGSFKGVYAVNNDGVEEIVECDDNILDWTCNPYFFEYNDNLYMENTFRDNDKYSRIDKNNKLIPIDNDSYHYGEVMYLTDELKIYYYDALDIRVIVNDKDEFNLTAYTGTAAGVYPYGDELYVMNGLGWLYKTNIYEDNGVCEYISTLNDKGCRVMEISGDYLYYSSYHGMYRYDLKSEELKTIDISEITSMNTYNGTVFYANKDGVFSCNKKGEIKKLTDISNSSIYIFDTEWVYLYNESGIIYRVSQNGDAVETIVLDEQ